MAIDVVNDKIIPEHEVDKIFKSDKPFKSYEPIYM